MKRTWLLIVFGFFVVSVAAQPEFYKNYTFTEADTLRGMLRPERTCYDVHFYELHLTIEPRKQFLEGYVDIHFRCLEDFDQLQVDLYNNMKINRIESAEKELTFDRKHDAVFVNCPPQKKGQTGCIRVYYEGYPQEAANAPWDEGFVWDTDQKGNPWVGVACEGAGASLWWPNKDHLSDEPDSMSISIAVPKGLTCVSNGNLRSVKEEKGWDRFNWFVSYPINNYNVTVNIGKYAHFSDAYYAEDGDTLALDYYVLTYNEKRAKEHFKQVPEVLACFERYFGKYPFWEDGYGLVETPYLGMEHQGAIAYGNKYMRGYLGGMIPRDMDWDYIIVHETGHEYFGNSISCYDMSEMWIHESFTTYMEALYVECAYSYEDAVRYLSSQLYYIANSEPILGPKDVNWEDWEDSDHYYKGAWMLQSLRHAIHNDELWFKLLRGFYEKNAISNVDTEDFVEYVNETTGRDFTAFFDQYLKYTRIPVLEYELFQSGKNLKVRYRWNADVKGFDMPLLVGRKGAYEMIYPKNIWQEKTFKKLKEEDFKVARELFLVRTKRIQSARG